MASPSKLTPSPSPFLKISFASIVYIAGMVAAVASIIMATQFQPADAPFYITVGIAYGCLGLYAIRTTIIFIRRQNSSRDVVSDVTWTIAFTTWATMAWAAHDASSLPISTTHAVWIPVAAMLTNILYGFIADTRHKRSPRNGGSHPTNDPNVA